MSEWLDCIPEKGAALELFKFCLNLILLLVTWTIGRWFLYKWDQYIKFRDLERDFVNDERTRIREISRDLRTQFHELYGSFKSNVRFWKIAGKPTEPSKCKELLEQAVRAEGQVEALISDIATLKTLNDNEVTTLGLYRQGYQSVRQAITKNRKEKVPSTYDTSPYHLFNDVTTQVSRIVVEIRLEPSAEDAQKNFDGVMDVRSDIWDEAIKCVDKKMKWKDVIAHATKERKKRQLI
tara:strand:+ start:178 stop:888 length:711 start_codon:yes stop_codon:yes gene_type:complete